MARDKKKKGRSGGSRFAAQSADEIEQRNRRLEEFDRRRREHRRAEGADMSDSDASGSDAEAPADLGDDAREAAFARMKLSADAGKPKTRGAEGVIDVENPNARRNRPVKIGDLAAKDPSQMTRKEREEADKAAAAAAYQRRHALGLTEEYKRDMSKLEEVRKRRAEADAKKKAMQEDMEAAEKEKKEAEILAGVRDDKKKKKKSGSSQAGGVAKLDKIVIKKMKPAMLKEALKERGLEIQGNSKQLMERLLKHETGC